MDIDWNAGDAIVFSSVAFYIFQLAFTDITRCFSNASTLEFSSSYVESITWFLSERICRKGICQSNADCTCSTRYCNDSCRYGCICIGLFHYLGSYSCNVGWLVAYAVYTMDIFFWNSNVCAYSKTGKNSTASGRCT